MSGCFVVAIYLQRLRCSYCQVASVEACNASNYPLAVRSRGDNDGLAELRRVMAGVVLSTEVCGENAVGNAHRLVRRGA